MPKLNKKQFVDWAEDIWKKNPRNLIKSIDYCKNNCPFYIPSCGFCIDRNSYEEEQFVSCCLWAINTNFELSPSLERKRADFRERYRRSVSEAQKNQKKTKVSSSVKPQKSSSWEGRTFDYTTEEINMTNKTAIDINENKVTFVNGRLVSIDDLRNNNS